MNVAVKIPMRMSVEEFMAWEPGDGRPWQLVDGVPEPMSPTNLTHGALQSELTTLLTNHLRERNSPCRVITAPGVVPHVLAGINVRIPDLAVTCSPPWATEEALLAAPVLLIEILSPSNQPETWSNVWTYTTIPSVQEILVLRSAAIGAELLRRQPDGNWPKDSETIAAGADLVLDSIGARIALDDLYRTTRLAPPPSH